MSNPNFTVPNFLDASEVAKILVRNLISFKYDFLGTVGGTPDHRFTFDNLTEAYEAIDEIAHLNLNITLEDR